MALVLHWQHLGDGRRAERDGGVASRHDRRQLLHAVAEWKAAGEQRSSCWTTHWLHVQAVEQHTCEQHSSCWATHWLHAVEQHTLLTQRSQVWCRDVSAHVANRVVAEANVVEYEVDQMRSVSRCAYRRRCEAEHGWRGVAWRRMVVVGVGESGSKVRRRPPFRITARCEQDLVPMRAAVARDDV